MRRRERFSTFYMKMAIYPPDQNLHSTKPQVNSQLSAQPRNSFDLTPEGRNAANNYKCARPRKYNKRKKPDNNVSDQLVMRQASRTRTIFNNAQLVQLEQYYVQGKYLSPLRLAEVSQALDLGSTQIRNWFKNRRRRQKIKSDLQKASESKCVPSSPAATNCKKTETSGSISRCNSFDSSTSSELSSEQCLSLNNSDGSIPISLTPSSTPNTPTSNYVESYGGSAFNSYYNDNHHTRSDYASLVYPYAASGTEYYQPPLMPMSLKHYGLQEQCPTALQRFEMGDKPQLASTKDHCDFSFDSLYYMRAPTSLLPYPAHFATSMYPTIDAYESVTEKRDDNLSISTEICSIQGPPIVDKTEAEIKMRVPTSNNGNIESLITKESSLNSHITILNNCSETFSKFSKMSSDTTNDLAYQCTMDTLIHAYNSHRNTQQFTTYCFN